MLFSSNIGISASTIATSTNTLFSSISMGNQSFSLHRNGPLGPNLKFLLLRPLEDSLSDTLISSCRNSFHLSYLSHYLDNQDLLSSHSTKQKHRWKYHSSGEMMWRANNFYLQKFYHTVYMIFFHHILSKTLLFWSFFYYIYLSKQFEHPSFRKIGTCTD